MGDECTLATWSPKYLLSLVPSALRNDPGRLSPPDPLNLPVFSAFQNSRVGHAYPHPRPFSFGMRVDYGFLLCTCSRNRSSPWPFCMYLVRQILLSTLFLCPHPSCRSFGFPPSASQFLHERAWARLNHLVNDPRAGRGLWRQSSRAVEVAVHPLLGNSNGSCSLNRHDETGARLEGRGRARRRRLGVGLDAEYCAQCTKPPPPHALR